jgi:hypothetical protein
MFSPQSRSATELGLFSGRTDGVVVNKRVIKSKVVSEGMLDDMWITDISGSLPIPALHQYVNLWSRMQSLTLSSNAEDKFI